MNRSNLFAVIFLGVLCLALGIWIEKISAPPSDPTLAKAVAIGG